MNNDDGNCEWGGREKQRHWPGTGPKSSQLVRSSCPALPLVLDQQRPECRLVPLLVPSRRPGPLASSSGLGVPRRTCGVRMSDGAASCRAEPRREEPLEWEPFLGRAVLALRWARDEPRHNKLLFFFVFFFV